MRKQTTFLILTLFLTACSIKTVTPNLFTADEHMVVTYSSQGCFHRSSNELVFHENNVSIYKTMNEWNKKIAKTKMGTLLLTQKDKEGLNKLFVYYDGKLSSGCTSVDNIEIKRYKKEVLISSKNIRDASCGQDDRDNVLSFRELIYRVTEKK
jgi:hypothetical protein